MQDLKDLQNEGLYDLLGALVDDATNEETRIQCAEALRDWPYARKHDRVDVLHTALQMREMVCGELQLAVDDLCDCLREYDLR